MNAVVTAAMTREAVHDAAPAPASLEAVVEVWGATPVPGLGGTEKSAARLTPRKTRSLIVGSTA
jgi:hypothetical protein